MPVNRLLSRGIVLAVSLALNAPLVPAVAQTQNIELPSLGEVAADDLSPTNERKLGEAIMRQVRRDPSYLDDPDTRDYLNNLGFQLVSNSPARYTDFQFFAIRDSTLNAFALLGGFIGVHTGLVLTAQSESELASVLGHEIGHIAQRHVARMLSRQKESTAIAIGALLLALLAARSGSSSSGALTEAAIMGGQAAALQTQLNFSREAEREADRIGFQILVDTGFDARAMSTFFGRMQQGTRVYESAAPEYLRTHPITSDRMADIQARLRDTRTRQRADSLDFQLVRARLRVLQEDTVQGARDALAYFEAALRPEASTSDAALYYGLAVAHLKLGQADAAAAAAQNARNRTKATSPMLDKLVSETRYVAAKSPEAQASAVALARDTAARFPVSRLTALHYADLLQRSGRHDELVNYLREQLAIPRSDIAYYSLLARSYAALNKRTLQHQATAEAYLQFGATQAAIEQLNLARRANDADYYVLSEVDARLRELQQRLREERIEAGKERRPAEEKK
jgi:predicted Zn-dependent protease